MHQQPPKIPLLRSVSSANAAQVDAPSGRTVYRIALPPSVSAAARSGLRGRLGQQAREPGRCADHGPVTGIDVGKRDIAAFRQLGHLALADPFPGLGRGELRADHHYRDVIAALVGKPDHAARDPFRHRDRSRPDGLLAPVAHTAGVRPLESAPPRPAHPAILDGKAAEVWLAVWTGEAADEDD